MNSKGSSPLRSLTQPLETSLSQATHSVYITGALYLVWSKPCAAASLPKNESAWVCCCWFCSKPWCPRLLSPHIVPGRHTYYPPAPMSHKTATLLPAQPFSPVATTPGMNVTIYGRGTRQHLPWTCLPLEMVPLAKQTGQSSRVRPFLLLCIIWLYRQGSRLV